MTVRIATLIGVYAGDSPELFTTAMQSVCAQRLPSDVVSRIYLGVDGPVSEALEAVIAQFRDQVFIVHRSPRNQGLARTLNALIGQLTDEDFVFRMDADDEALPDRYRLQLDHMASHPDIDILGTAIIEVDCQTGEERHVAFAGGPQDAVQNIHRRVPVAHPTVCMRRSVLRIIGGYPVVGTNEDVAMWFACVRHGLRFDNLPQHLLRFRISTAFWKRRSFDKARSEFWCYVRGIHALNGLLTWKYAYPVLRLSVRLAPTAVAKWAYRSSFRKVRSRV
jgi:glycosyltransferase involved in cell wall biosynthesis